MLNLIYSSKTHGVPLPINNQMSIHEIQSFAYVKTGGKEKKIILHCIF